MEIFYSLVLPSCITLITSIVLLVASEIIKIYVLNPVQRLKEHIPVVIGKVDFYINRLTNYFPEQLSEDDLITIRAIRKELREAATVMKSIYTIIPMKTRLSKMRLIPKEYEIKIAYESLIYLHNSILITNQRTIISNELEMNDNRIERIRSALTGDKIPDLLKAIEFK